MTHTVESLMSQAQVFASAWALVGSHFDRGGCFDDAEEAKSELKAMLEETFDALVIANAEVSRLKKALNI